MKFVSTMNAIAFIQYRTMFEWVRNDGWQTGKAFVLLNTVHIVFLVALVPLWELCVGYRVHIRSSSLAPWLVAGTVVTTNFLTLYSGDSWKQYAANFDQLSKPRRVLARIAVFVVTLAIVLFFIVFVESAKKLPELGIAESGVIPTEWNNWHRS